MVKLYMKILKENELISLIFASVLSFVIERLKVLMVHAYFQKRLNIT